ncbi:MAG TPA: SGNH/GDSL hydrolase family protein [Vicinamibacteria bacterium]|nr:SGNH/GDSL hydrolase family protein [Vicinamibacteria bacterium]
MRPPRTSVFTALLVVAALLAGEVVFRAVFPLPQVSNLNRMDYSEVPPEFRLRRPQLMNASFRWASEPDRASFVHALNLYGFRDASTWCVRPPARAARVMFVGDSFVEGVMAPDDATIPRAFARAVPPTHAVEAMNLGIGGTGLAHQLRLLAAAVPLFRPRAVILVLYANDLPPPPFDARWLREPWRPVYFKRWLPRPAHVALRAWRGAAVPRRWHTAPFPFFGPVPDPTNPLTGRAAGYEPLVEPALLDAMRRGALNPYLADHLERSALDLLAAADAAPHLRAARDLARAHGAALRVAYLPHSLQVSDYYMSFARRYAVIKPAESLTGPEYQRQAAALGEACRALEVPFLDLTPPLRREEEAGRRLYWDYDNHMRPEGYAFVATLLADWWAGAARESGTGPSAPPAGGLS